jgi:predicted HTH transcriptional regulator
MKYPNEESSTLEFKREVPENDQIIKTMIGFCNRNGGKLVLGVGSNGLIVGIPDGDIQNLMESIHKSIFDACSPSIVPAVYSQRIEDKNLLIIEVSSGMNKPYFRKSEGLSKGTFVRLGRSTIRATQDIIEELKWQSTGKSFDAMPLYYAKTNDLEEKKFLHF